MEINKRRYLIVNIVWVCAGLFCTLNYYWHPENEGTLIYLLGRIADIYNYFYFLSINYVLVGILGITSILLKAENNKIYKILMWLVIAASGMPILFSIVFLFNGWENYHASSLDSLIFVAIYIPQIIFHIKLDNANEEAKGRKALASIALASIILAIQIYNAISVIIYKAQQGSIFTQMQGGI